MLVFVAVTANSECSNDYACEQEGDLGLSGMVGRGNAGNSQSYYTSAHTHSLQPQRRDRFTSPSDINTVPEHDI